MRKIIKCLIVCLMFLLITSCDANEQAEELCVLGNVPPEVIHVDLTIQHGVPIADEISPAKTFEDYEERLKSCWAEDYVILECEMLDDGILKKNTEFNYGSYVKTKVKILRVHEKGTGVPDDVSNNSVFSVKEPYFKITPDMDGILEDFEDGTYVTTSNYYPMMKGERYILFGIYETDKDGNVLLRPYLGSGNYCLSEGVMHYQRQQTYDSLNKVYSAGAILKYSGLKEFTHVYEDVFSEEENSVFKVNYESDTKSLQYSTFQERIADFIEESKGNGVILSCHIMDYGRNARISKNEYLKNYQECTKTDVRVIDCFYMGNEISEELADRFFYYGEQFTVLEPYYETTKNNVDVHVTHNIYIPIEASQGRWRENVFCLFAYVTEYENETVLVAAGDISVVSTKGSDYIPEHQQILLGPEGMLCYMETKVGCMDYGLEWQREYRQNLKK